MLYLRKIYTISSNLRPQNDNNHKNALIWPNSRFKFSGYRNVLQHKACSRMPEKIVQFHAFDGRDNYYYYYLVREGNRHRHFGNPSTLLPSPVVKIYGKHNKCLLSCGINLNVVKVINVSWSE